MLVAEQKRSELKDAILREQQAHERRENAQLRVTEVAQRAGLSAEMNACVHEAERADEEWRIAKAELIRLTLTSTL